MNKEEILYANLFNNVLLQTILKKLCKNNEEFEKIIKYASDTATEALEEYKKVKDNDN